MGEGKQYCLEKFDSIDEAREVYECLVIHPHPCVASVWRPVVVEGSAYLAFEKLGTALGEFLSSREIGKKLYLLHRVSDLYRKILTDLILLVEHLANTKINCSLDLNDVRIIEGKFPHIIVTKFGLRGDASKKEDWKNLAATIEIINKKSGYVQGVEMKSLLTTLKLASPSSLKHLFSNTLFWSRQQRKKYTFNLWDVLQYSGKPIHNSQTKHVFQNWAAKIDSNSQLNLLKAQTEAYKDIVLSKRGVNPVADLFWARQSKQRSSLPIGDDQMRDRFNFIRKTLCHFETIRKNILDEQARKKLANPDIKITELNLESVEKLQDYYEECFPDYIYELARQSASAELWSKEDLLPSYRKLNLMQ